MIYLVTKNQELFSNDLYKIISVDESLHLLSSLDKIGIDSETNGLSAWDNDLLLFQFGCKEFQVVVDCRTVDIENYKELLESNKKFIGWNLKFDLQFLYKHNIICTNIYDGMIVEKLLFLGYPSKMHPLSLKHAGQKYLNIELDKSVRGKIIWSKTLTDDIIIYSAEDVAHLEDICNKQIECLKEKDLIIAAKVENAFIPSLAYTEWCGIKLDKEKWKQKMQKDKERLDNAISTLEEWFLKNEPNSPYIEIDRQGDLFAENPFDLTPKVTINWNSAKQLIPIFKKYGVDVTIEDRDKGGTKDSIDVKTLKPQANKCDLILPYIEYKEAFKVVSTYGDKFLKQINPKTGRIKSKFNQLGADTSRLSSGGNDGDIEYINFQNLPADAETRSCFTCEKGNKFLSIDFCGEELTNVAI